MKMQDKKYLWLTVCFMLVGLITAASVFAQDKPPTHPSITNQINSYPALPASDKPPTTPPQEVKKEFTGSPVTDKPPTHPPQVDKYQNTQVLENAVADYPPPPPPVEAPKPVFGGPVNDKLPDPPTGPPDKTIRGIKEIHADIPSPTAGIKDEVIQIDTTRRQGASSQDATMPTKTIIISKEPVGPKKETEKISLPARISGKKEQINIINKPLPERSLKKQEGSIQETTRSISREPNQKK